MSKVVGIRFRGRGKVYEFDAQHFVLKKGDKVVILTDDGPTIGSVVEEPQERGMKNLKHPLKKIFRLAVKEEIERYEEGCALEDEIYSYCSLRIQERDLPMFLVSVERLFDGSKIVIYFTAEGRVDFRKLLKDLVGKFRTRIEMRQIGVRQEAGMVGGIGTCGRSLCCASFLEDFAPVTIKMAKGQNISLNPSKISGMCGRLMCCLTYEHEYYERTKKGLPGVGKKVVTELGEGKIVRQNVLKGTLSVMLESGDTVEVEAEDLGDNAVGKKNKK